MFLAKWALYFNDEEFSEQLSQFSRTDAWLKLATFRLKYEDDYDYKFSVLKKKTLSSEGETFRSAHAQNVKFIHIVDLVLQSEGHYYCKQGDPTSQLRQTISTLSSVYPSTVGEG